MRPASQQASASGWECRPREGRKDAPGRSRPRRARRPPAPEPRRRSGLGGAPRPHLAKARGSPPSPSPSGAGSRLWRTKTTSPGTGAQLYGPRTSRRPPRDPRQPIEARPGPPRRRRLGARAAPPAARRPSPVPLRCSLLGAAAIFLEERTRGERSPPRGRSELLPPPALPPSPSLLTGHLAPSKETLFPPF